MKIEVKNIFLELESKKSIEEVNKYLSELEKKLILPKHKLDEKKYPPIQFQITKEELEELNLDFDKNDFGDMKNADALTRLLYAALWKRGDLPKIKHIVNGILDKSTDDQKNGLIYHQFGRYLTKTEGEPIVDQHVLRAFEAYKPEYTNTTELINAYKNWIKNDLKTELRTENEYCHAIDKVLFAVGKAIKESTN